MGVVPADRHDDAVPRLDPMDRGRFAPGLGRNGATSEAQARNARGLGPARRVLRGWLERKVHDP